LRLLRKSFAVGATAAGAVPAQSQEVWGEIIEG